MRTRVLSVLGLAAGLLLVTAATSAAGGRFGPGDLRLCSAKRCVEIIDPAVLRSLSSFYYYGPAPAHVHPPRLGAPYFQLTFRTGYITGVAATTKLDRFRSGGVNLARFGADDWYRVPARAAAGLRRAASVLRPLRVTESTIGPIRHA
jgi:hypothetical protein